MKTTLCLLTCGLLLLLSSCAGISAGSTERPNTYQDVTTQPGQRDPYNHLNPALRDRDLPFTPLGNSNGNSRGGPQTCFMQCKPGEHCDASGPVERCVGDEGK